MLSNIELTQVITLKIGVTSYEVTRDTAEKLYNQLGKMLNKTPSAIATYPTGVRPAWGGVTAMNCTTQGTL
jgi:hypothetical protein